MGLISTLFNFKSDPITLLRQKINGRIIRALQRNEMPWQKPWEGRGKGVGFPCEISTKNKVFGINFLLLQMSAKDHGFVSNLWGTSSQLKNMKVMERPDDVSPGSWATEIIYYENNIPTSYVVYNLDQVVNLPEAYQAKINFTPYYDLAEKVLHSTGARIKFNKGKKALYFYPPNDFIKFPEKRLFEAGIGGLPGYYDSLAHELMHWTESRVGFDTDCNEGIRELRADIGAAMLMEELGVPHSMGHSNFYKWKDRWIKLLKNDYNLIFKVCAAACKGAEYINKHSEIKFNRIDECVA